MGYPHWESNVCGLVTIELLFIYETQPQHAPSYITTFKFFCMISCDSKYNNIMEVDASGSHLPDMPQSLPSCHFGSVLPPLWIPAASVE